MLKEQIRRNALVYLNGKQGEKGKEIKYTSLEMSEYLQPINNELSIEQKREMFSVKNRMIDIPYNFPRKNMHNIWANFPSHSINLLQLVILAL